MADMTEGPRHSETSREWTTRMWFVPDGEGRIDLRRMFGYSTPIDHYEVVGYEDGEVTIKTCPARATGDECPS